MVELGHYQTISMIFAGLSISVAAFNYILNLRNQKISRKKMLYLQVYTRFQDKTLRAHLETMYDMCNQGA